jgi:phage replication-related protein YjqB (UPF0714/DUF867 family)
MDDRYGSFAELAESEKEGRDYCLEFEDRETEIVVMTPHGGGIEQGTSEIVKAVAGEELSYYCFNGIKRSGNKDLHIGSTRFDEPSGVALVERSQAAVAIHGLEGQGEVIQVGGLDEDLKGGLLQALLDAGFEAREDDSHHSGTFPSNLCNRGATGQGVQLEIPEGLRRTMFKSLKRRGRQFKKPPFYKFVAVIRGVLLTAQ